MAKLIYAGASDIGYQRTVNEDFLYVKALDDTTTLVIVADGAGSTGTTFQPASIASLEIYDAVSRVFSTDKDVFLQNAALFLKEAIVSAGRVLGAFQMANEELYNGYAASLTCCLFHEDVLTFAHTGNTRINLIRKNQKTGNVDVKQLTRDQTEGQRLVDDGTYSVNDYHLSRERLIVTGGIGVNAIPDVQTFSMPLRENDFILTTTDGIHYAIRPDVFADVMSHSQTCDDCVQALIQAAKVVEYADNATACLCWYAAD